MNVKDRIRDQLPTIFNTLVSVLIGLVLADLVTEARARMQLWLLDEMTLRTWAQIFAVGTSALSAWTVFSHIGISRHRIPALSDSRIAFAVPLVLLITNIFVSRADIWPWFYIAGIYLAFAAATSAAHICMGLREAELSGMRHLLRPAGRLGYIAVGVPSFLLAGWLDQHHYMSLMAELIAAILPAPMALLVLQLFFCDWHYAIGATLSETGL